MTYSNTTKHNLLHTLRDMKKAEDIKGFCDWCTWDEYDLDYLISLVEKDV